MFNSDKKAIPVAWIIAPRFVTTGTHRWMRALYNRVRTKDPTWKLAGFILDDPLFDVHTIRYSLFSALFELSLKLECADKSGL